MKVFHRSLRGRLLVLVSGTVVIVWVLTAAMTWFDARHQVDELLDGRLSQIGAILLAQEVQEASEGELDIDATVLHRYAPKVAVQVFYAERLAMRSVNAPTLPLFGEVTGAQTGFKTLRVDGVDWRVFAAFDPGQGVQVFVGEELGLRTSVVWSVLRASFWPMAVALPLLILAAGWAVRRGVEPLRRLSVALAARDASALQPMAVEGAPSEMMPMFDALNGLFGRIGLLVDAERRFTADAAHELRTPIAATRAQAQVALCEPQPVLRQRALQATVAGCDRAAWVIDQMLTLARLEGGCGANLQRIDLAPIVRRVCAELAPLAIERHQAMELLSEGPCPVTGEASLIGILLRNLVDNAIRYSPRRATVTISVEASASGTCVVVEDSGPGISEADRSRLGERFFRVLGSGEAGSGLGWSIVRRVAMVHEIELTIDRSSALGGLRVAARFPAGPQRARFAQATAVPNSVPTP